MGTFCYGGRAGRGPRRSSPPGARTRRLQSSRDLPSPCTLPPTMPGGPRGLPETQPRVGRAPSGPPSLPAPSGGQRARNQEHRDRRTMTTCGHGHDTSAPRMRRQLFSPGARHVLDSWATSNLCLQVTDTGPATPAGGGALCAGSSLHPPGEPPPCLPPPSPVRVALVGGEHAGGAHPAPRLRAAGCWRLPSLSAASEQATVRASQQPAGPAPGGTWPLEPEEENVGGPQLRLDGTSLPRPAGLQLRLVLDHSAEPFPG